MMRKSKSMIRIWVALVLVLGFAAHVIGLGQNLTPGNAVSSNQTEVQAGAQSAEPAGETTKAEEQSEDTTQSQKGTSLYELFSLGGPFMWPLLLFSILVIGVILERTIVYSTLRFNVKKLGTDMLSHLKEKNIGKAVQICDLQNNNVGCQIFQKSIPLLGKGIVDFEKAIETHSAVRVAGLEKNLNLLSTMGNIAPLTGFLGTVSGMITAFKTIALSDNVTARLVAGGIYEALITTAFGLIIAIVAVGANNFFVHKVDSFVNEMEETVSLISEEVMG